MMPKCEICGREFDPKRRLNVHYGKIHPDFKYEKAELTEGHKRKIGIANKGNPPWSAGLTKETDKRLMKISKHMKERTKNWNPMDSEDARRKQSQSQRGRTPWNKGLTKETDERVKKYAEQKKGRNNPMKNEVAKKKMIRSLTGRKLSISHKKHISEGHKRRYEKESHWTQTPEGCERRRAWRDKISESVKKLIEGGRFQLLTEKRPTSIERKVNEINTKYSLPFRYVGNGVIWIARKNPDFINNNGKKQLIEVMGNYWHDESNARARTQHFGKYGYRVLTLWGNWINNHTQQEIADMIKKFEGGDSNIVSPTS